MKQHSTAMNVTLWTVTVLVAALFFVAGGAAIGGWMDERFVAWGYSTGFAVLIGVLEVIFAIALLIQRSAAWASFGLLAIMLGAIGTHLTHAEYAWVALPIGVALLLGFIAWGRGPERSASPRLQRHRPPTETPATSQA